jgi:hypothetical protein
MSLHRPKNFWSADKWPLLWQKRGPQPMTSERLKRRNEIQAFRLVLARKEPK